MMDYPNAIQALVLGVFSAYWLSIALSSKDGPYGILAGARGMFPILEDRDMVGRVMAFVVAAITLVVPYVWVVFSPVAVAGIVITLLINFGVKDY